MEQHTKNTPQKPSLPIWIIVLSLVFLHRAEKVCAAAGWYDTSWSHRRAITIDNTEDPNSLTNYQVKIRLTPDNFDYSKASSTGADIRFTDSDGTTLIDYWIEDWNNADANIWVEVPSVPASSTKTIYMYYGNSEASTTSSGNNTFRFFDDFSQGRLWKWEYSDADFPDASTFFHMSVIKNGKYYSVDAGSPYKLREINVLTGELLNSVTLDGGSWCVPQIVGDYIYVYAQGANKLYKISIDSWTIDRSIGVSGSGVVETFTVDDNFIYLPESNKISKRNLSDLVEVSSFPCSPGGVLRIGSTLYFTTHNGRFCAVDTSSMTEAWPYITLDIADNHSYAVPMYDRDNDRIYVADASSGRTDGNVYAIDPNTHEIVWKVDTPAGYGVPHAPSYHNNKLFVAYYNPAAGGQGYYKALDVTGGTYNGEIWSKQFYNDDAWGSLTLDDNYIYTLTYPTGEAPPYYFIIFKQDNGELVHSELINYIRTCAPIAISNGMAIFGTEKQIYGFEVGTGSSVDFYPYYGNADYTGYVENAITAYKDFSLADAEWTNIGYFSTQNGTLKKYAAYTAPSFSIQYWRGIAMSSDGQNQTVVAYDNYIYVSNDGGNNWQAKDEDIRLWRGIAMSDTGQNQTAVAYGDYIYVSSDYGNSWTQKGNIQNWNGIAMSDTGQNQTAVADNDYIYVSNDGGNNWQAKDEVRHWRGIAMSSDGQYQTAVADNNYIYVSNDGGNNWQAKNEVRHWTGVAMSSDGQNQTGVAYNDYIYVSIDYGNTWTQKGSWKIWSGIAMSSDGQRQTAVAYNDYIYVSTNGGNNWEAKDDVRLWRGIAMSSDGKYQTAVADSDYIYLSTNNGDNWIQAGRSQNYLLISKDTFTYPLAVETRAKVGSDWDNEYGWNFAVSWDSDWSTTGYLGGHYKYTSSDYSYLKRFSSEAETNSNETNESISADTWYRLSLLINSSNQYYKVGGVQKAALTTSSPTEDPTNIILSTSRLSSSGGYTTYFDWVFVREYSSPEPSATAGPEQTFYSADIDTDGDVDFLDYARFANYWMDESCAEPSWCGGADLNKSGQVNAPDLLVLAEHWLEGK